MPGVARGIDHLVIAVRDLDAAGDFYTQLGFTVGARNRHPWGTENRIVQLDGAFLELVSVADETQIPPHGPRRFSFGAFVRDYLAVREGFAMLVLESRDAAADARQFAASGVGDFEPFFFERRGRRPDGSETTVAFTLAFARDAGALNIGFFTCQHHHPENFWNAAFQQHANGARSIGAVVMAAENPTDHHIFLTAFTGQRDLHATSLGVSAQLPRGRFDILSPHACGSLYGLANAPRDPALVAFTIAVDDLPAVAARITAAGIPSRSMGPRLVVPPEAAFGVAIAFDEAEWIAEA
jgi:catechol 2,3-dioxygenase-like lactoylglutathione lyase family enzyme